MPAMDYDPVVEVPSQRSPEPSTDGRDGNSPPPDDLPACLSCRRRKSKCSREVPSCSQCIKIRCECQYAVKQKPGMKAGAVDTLSRRIDILERILLGNNGSRDQLEALIGDTGLLQSQASVRAGTSTTAGTESNDNESALPQQQHLLEEDSNATNNTAQRKRQRTHNDDDTEELEDFANDSSGLPPYRLLEAVVEAHFNTVHHWVPILHETRFRSRLKKPEERHRLRILLHALLSTSIKYVNFKDFHMTFRDAERQIRNSRRIVMTEAMGSLSLENTQALVLLAFDYMGSGQSTKAWPIIGSLTRTVDYLQLTVEPDEESHKQTLLRSLRILGKPFDWTDSEERRRLFWAVFLLDRVCSITSGWHTSLTSDDVRRRLPCGGGMWARSEPVSTPFFGIWDKSSAKIGNSISNVPTIYPSPKPMHHASPGSSGVAEVDTSKLGAFAYCIEATENLSQVTSFFLQQGVDFGDREEVKNWLTRFKELDLRLVHWKMFLPQQWQDSDVSRDAHIIKMDPNLTLAHISHNTSTILLHQHIAYPPTAWRDVVKLPSSCSAETCQFAAVETASIVQKYLRYMGGIVNSQFAFCAFVAAKVLLVHWKINNTNNLADEFLSLVQSLQDISDLWCGYYKPKHNTNGDRPVIQDESAFHEQDLAAQYAAQLQFWHSRCLHDPTFTQSDLVDILCEASLDGLVGNASVSRVETAGNSMNRNGNDSVHRIPTGFTPSQDGQIRSAAATSGWQPPYQQSRRDGMPVLRPASGARLSTAYERQGTVVSPEERSSVSHRGYGQSPSNAIPSGTSPTTFAANMSLDPGVASNRPILRGEDELTAMSHMLLGNQFLEMDRVITLDGTEFFSYDPTGRTVLS